MTMRLSPALLAAAAAPVTAASPSCERFTPYFLRYLGDPVLHTACITVERPDEIEPGLVGALLRLCTKHHGLGLSANQVGGRQRVCVMRVTAQHGAVLSLVNPRLLAHAPEKVRCIGEGCLSIPGFRTTTFRYPWVEIEYETPSAFATESRRFEGLDAQVIQHELEHLAGRLIVDDLPRQQQRAAERMIEKFLARERKARALSSEGVR